MSVSLSPPDANGTISLATDTVQRDGEPGPDLIVGEFALDSKGIYVFRPLNINVVYHTEFIQAIAEKLYSLNKRIEYKGEQLH